MCGLAGIFTVERPVDAVLVHAVLRMLDRQRHRGPDDWGLLLPEGARALPEIAHLLRDVEPDRVRTYPGSAEPPAAVLGSRRLSILDRSPAGRMPMGTPDGLVWTTYNGEVYNFRELRDELRSLGHSFQSTGDSEVLLNAYSEWGADMFKRLSGMFALGILDLRRPGTPRLVLGRDRFGMKPLYWARHQCVFQFASEVKALRAGGLTPHEPEPRGFHGFLLHGSVPSPWTTDRGFFSLVPAHTLEVDERTYSYPRPRRYWTLPDQGSKRLSDSEAVAEVARLTDDAVASHLVSDAPLGVFLSGGTDSSALVGFASRHVSRPLVTLSVTFDESEFSEREHAEAVARKFGTDHHDVRVRARDFAQELPRIMAAMDQPTIDGVNTYFVAKAAREVGLTVALSGLGGDEVFWGYPGFTRAPRLARIAGLPGSRTVARALGNLAVRIGLPRFEKLGFLGESRPLGPYLAIRGLFTPTRAARLLASEALPVEQPDDIGGAMDSAAYGRLEISAYLSNQLLRDADVFGMAHSVEIRVPFLDHRLVELVYSLEPALLASRSYEKPLLRRAVEAGLDWRLPIRPKMGFALPMQDWLLQEWSAVHGGTNWGAPLDPTAVEETFAGFRAGSLHWSRAWALVAMQAMARGGNLPAWSSHPKRGRLLFILPQVYGAKGGIPTYNQHLLKAAGEALPRGGITVVAANDIGLPSDAPIRGRATFIACGPRTKRFHKMRFALRALGVAGRLRPDHLICGHLNHAPLAVVLGLVSGSPVTLLALGIEAWNPSTARRWAAKRMRRVLAISRFTAARMEEWGIDPRRVRLLPNCVDGDVFRVPSARPQGEHRVVLSVARLAASERYKGMDRVLNVFSRLNESVAGSQCWLVGGGDDRPRLEALARDLGVGAAVRFLGEVSDAELAELYANADVFVMPSKKEGFGFVFLEAMASGTPVVAGNRDGSVDALLDGELGRLIDPDDEDALAQAIKASLAGPAITRERRLVLRARVLAAYGLDRFRDRVRTEFQ